MLLVAELRGGSRAPRKSVLKRGSFMGIRAPAAFTSAADQVRRRSGDAYAASHKLLSGASPQADRAALWSCPTLTTHCPK